MRKFISVFIFIPVLLYSQILVIDSEGKDNVINDIKKYIPNIKVIKPGEFNEDVSIYKFLILLGDKALSLYREKNLEKECVAGYIKNPFLEIPITGTGIRYTLSASAVIRIIANSSPWAKKIGTIVPEKYMNTPYIEELIRTSKTLGIDVKVVYLRGMALKKALNELKGVNLILLIPSELTLPEENARYIIQQAFNMKIPVFGFEKKHLNMGALMCYDLEKSYKNEFISLLNKVLNGRNPATIPVKYPENYQVLIKKKIRKIFKLKIDLFTLKNAREI